jgi:hypothetical protein
MFLRVRGASAALRVTESSLATLHELVFLNLEGSDATDRFLPSPDLRFRASKPPIPALSELLSIFGNICRHFVDSESPRVLDLRAALALHELGFLLEGAARRDTSALKDDFARVMRAAVLSRPAERAAVRRLKPLFAALSRPPDQARTEQPDDESRIRAMWLLEVRREAVLQAQVADADAQVRQMLEARKDLFGDILSKTRIIHQHREEDKADRRNLRLISDVVFAIDEINHERRTRGIAAPPMRQINGSE